MKVFARSVAPLRRAALPIAAGAVLAATLGLAACGSSASSPETKTGMEHFASVLRGAATQASSFPLTYTGPVAATGSFGYDGSAPKPGQEMAFKTSAGTLTLHVVSVPASNALSRNETTCYFASVTSVNYTVVGTKSTGKFAGATGSGKVTITVSANGPKLADGKCIWSNSAEPIESTARASFIGAGPLTVKA
jgi:hypothetical protein